MTNTKKFYAATLMLVAIAAGCQCNGPGTSRRNASIEEEKTLVEFGQVQVNFEHQQPLRIINAGSATLNITELRAAEPFGVLDEVPLSVGPGQNIVLTVTFMPTVVGKRELGKLVIVSDDPDRPEVTITLQGTGIQATAEANPSPIDFGDVFLGESRKVALTIHNRGTNELKVTKAELLPETSSEVTGDLGPISQNVPAGGSTTTELTFAPTAMSHSIPGGVKLTLDPLQGGELVIPFKGRGTRSIPRLCWQFEGQGMSSCTDPEANQSNPGGILPAFPPLCDSQIHPADGGTNPCGNTPYEMTGKLFVVNEGNVPIKYSMQYTASTTNKGCDGGTPADPDFIFSNAPTPSTRTWQVATVELAPGGMSDSVNVTYRPTSRCPDETADTALVLWTRQGDNLPEQQRQPINLNAFFNGQSRLPYAVPADVNFNITGAEAQLPQEQAFFGVKNQGTADFQVPAGGVMLKELITTTGCEKPDPAALQECDATRSADSQSHCYYFAWADGQNPNDAAHTIPNPADGGTGTTEIGRILFAPNGAPPNETHCVFAVIQTTDPYHPQVISKIRGVYSP